MSVCEPPRPQKTHTSVLSQREGGIRRRERVERKKKKRKKGMTESTSLNHQLMALASLGLRMAKQSGEIYGHDFPVVGKQSKRRTSGGPFFRTKKSLSAPPRLSLLTLLSAGRLFAHFNALITPQHLCAVIQVYGCGSS